MLQDGAQRSWLLQIVSGVSSVIASIFLGAALNVFKEVELLELLRTMLLPLVLMSLYLSTLLGVAGLPIYMAILEICYLSVFVVIMSVPRILPERERFALLCRAFFSSRLGWAVGFFGFYLLSPRWGNVLIAVLVLLSFAIMLVLVGHRAIRGARRSVNQAFEIEKKASRESVDDTFGLACEKVACAYQLTPRESEVLPLLAKGRNARYVANALIISDGTARTHIMHIYQKMKVNSQQSLMDIVDNAATER